MRFRLIDAAKEEFPVQRLCEVLGVSQSGYFAWRGRPACRRQREDMVLLAHLRSAFALSNGTYGSPRMTRELQDDGLKVGRRRTARLMRENGLRARQTRRFKCTTVIMPGRSRRTSSIRTSRPSGRTRSGEQTSPMSGPAKDGCIWPSSSTSSPAVSSAGRLGDRLHRDLALAALRRALLTRRPLAGLIHHSDRGSQYCSIDYQAELHRHGIPTSMSGKGNCYDNAMVETFFKTLKSELVWRTVFQTRSEAEQAIARYIDGFYNHIRRHSALDFVSPVQFEKLAAN